MIIEFLQTNQICRVHWGYTLKRIIAKAENLKTIAKKIEFLQEVIDALETDDISHLDCFVEAITQYDNQTKDGVKDCLQRKINNLYKVVSMAEPSTIDNSEERIHGDQKKGEDLTQKERITEDELKEYFMPYVYKIIVPGKNLKNGEQATLFTLLIEEIDEFIIKLKLAAIYASTVARKIFKNNMLIKEKVNSFTKWQKIFSAYLGIDMNYKLNQTEGYGEFTSSFTSLK